MAVSTSRADHEKSLQKWLEHYQEKGLSRSQCLGSLYDIGFDLPEAHVIRKDKEMYYAFLARNWKAPWSCAARTIVRITSSTMWTKRFRNRPRSGHALIRFSKHLLLEGTPQQTY
jgi:alpha-galactosidase